MATTEFAHSTWARWSAGNDTTAIGLAPGGNTATVLGTYDGTVRLLNTRTRWASRPIKVGALPVAAAVTR